MSFALPWTFARSCSSESSSLATSSRSISGAPGLSSSVVLIACTPSASPFRHDIPPQCGWSAWRLSACSGTSLSTFACVASRTTLGALPASQASIQRSTCRHQRSPGCRPRKRISGRGVPRSLPRSREYSRNSAVTRTQTRCATPCSPRVAQHPSRKKPVSGAKLHASSGPPRTFFSLDTSSFMISSGRRGRRPRAELARTPRKRRVEGEKAGRLAAQRQMKCISDVHARLDPPERNADCLLVLRPNARQRKYSAQRGKNFFACRIPDSQYPCQFQEHRDGDEHLLVGLEHGDRPAMLGRVVLEQEAGEKIGIDADHRRCRPERLVRSSSARTAFRIAASSSCGVIR